MNHSCVEFVEALGNGAWGELTLTAVQSHATLSGLTPWTHHRAVPESFSYTSLPTHTRGARYAKLHERQKEVSKENIHTANWWAELDSYTLAAERTIFPQTNFYGK